MSLAVGALLLPINAFAALQASETAWDGSEPPQGIYFHWYEPSFYAGFAPQTQDPSRAHIELSRGNQVRLTMVLGEAEIDTYLDDLVKRRDTYQELVDRKVIELTTNREYERFVVRMDQHGVAATAGNRAALGVDGYRQKSVEVMQGLNPDRVFRVHIPFAPLATAWHARLVAASPADLAADPPRLDLANALLPGRIALYRMDSLSGALAAAADAARAAPANDPAFVAKAAEFLDQATGGHYRVRDGFVDAVEFTAIYPAGTVEGTTTYKGEKLPDFGVTGMWPLIARTQGRGLTGMVDYISPNPGYGFISMLPYQHAGGIAYNAFHNAGVRCELSATRFLPPAWRKVASERDGKKPYQNLWIVSRGPTSHGCTRLGSGHMTELRNSLPASSKTLEQVTHYRDLPQCYDVFDVDGSGTPRVMGVQYYLAYRSDEHTPIASYVTNKRDPYYRWLYGENIALAPPGQASLKSVPVCRFVGRKAQEAETLTDVPLYEPAWTPETIQFYTLKPAAFSSNPGFEFNRELRKVGAGHTTDRQKLFLK
ncbi:MAG: hypothetical protein ACRERC_25750 [Candidatus Binatia bacterium]